MHQYERRRYAIEDVIVCYGRARLLDDVLTSSEADRGCFRYCTGMPFLRGGKQAWDAGL